MPPSIDDVSFTSRSVSEDCALSEEMARSPVSRSSRGDVTRRLLFAFRRSRRRLDESETKAPEVAVVAAPEAAVLAMPLLLFVDVAVVTTAASTRAVGDEPRRRCWC